MFPGYLYLVACFTILYYTGGIKWFMDVLLPFLPGLNVRQGIFLLTDAGDELWQLALKVSCCPRDN